MQKRGPIVWIIRETLMRRPGGYEQLDYTPAEKFGEIKFITNVNLPVFMGRASELFAQQQAQFLNSYDKQQDYVVLTGSPLSIFVTGYLMGQYGKGANLLIWDRERGQYQPQLLKDTFMTDNGQDIMVPF